MIHPNTIRAYARRVAKEFKPRKIILFGSYAYGKPTEDSDVDLLVIMPHKGRSVEKAIEINLRLNASFAMDLLVRSPQVVRELSRKGDSFIAMVMQKGKVLYES